MVKTIVTSSLLGVGLAMDAAAVSMANGMNKPCMKVKRVLLIATMFGFFQGVMPFIGYLLGSVILSKIEWIIPWVALLLLSFIGGKMLLDGIKNQEEDCEEKEELTFKVLLVQAIATSIDALSVGFTISNYTLFEAIVAVLLIAIVTFIISFIAVYLGKKFGIKLGNKAVILGGLILIAIGVEIFISGLII